MQQALAALPQDIGHRVETCDEFRLKEEVAQLKGALQLMQDTPVCDAMQELAMAQAARARVESYWQDAHAELVSMAETKRVLQEKYDKLQQETDASLAAKAKGLATATAKLVGKLGPAKRAKQ